MKLRNKKTGEIIDDGYIRESNDFYRNGKRTIAVFVQGENRPPERVSIGYETLAELNEEWEDYEEPMEYYFIDGDGSIETTNRDGVGGDEMGRNMIAIGNHFKTEEEAEKAVEKLEAITRLNKCGFRFEGYTDRDRASGGDIVIYAHVDIPNNNLLEEAQPDMLKDLDLLFGGEE